MTLDLRELRRFVTVAELGSIGRAAAALGISQPGISRSVRALEHRLGGPLFERDARGMALTGAGETLLPHARLLLFEAAQAVDAVQALRGLRHGRVRIGVVATVAQAFLPEILQRLLAEAPELTVDVLEGVEDALSDALIQRVVDLIIASDLPTDAPVLSLGECRFSDHYAVICAAEHPLAQRPRVELKEALGEAWVMPAAGATPRTLFERVLTAADQAPPHIAVQTRSPQAIIALVSRSRLLGWVPRPLVEAELATGSIALLDVPGLSLPRRFQLYRRARGVLPAAAAKLAELTPLETRPSHHRLLFGHGATL